MKKSPMFLQPTGHILLCSEPNISENKNLNKVRDDRAWTPNHLTWDDPKMKVFAWNYFLKKLFGIDWGACPITLRTSVLVLCYSVSEYVHMFHLVNVKTHKSGLL